METNLSTCEDKRQAKRRKLIVDVSTVIVAAVALQYRNKHIPREPRDENHHQLERNMLLRRLYNGSDENCYNQLRLTKRAFFDLCNILREKGGLRATYHVSVEEAVAMFLLILAHGVKMRVLGGTYIRSLETISRYFGLVLRAIIGLSKEYIKLHDSTPTDSDDEKLRWFKDSIGALDGTHIPVTVPLKDQGRYRNRKQQITTNVLGVCDRNMKFIYVLPRLEGSSSDSRVLRSAMTKDDPFIIPNGKYFLVDVGYMNAPGFLAPYRSTRYHLSEWSRCGNNPTNYKELFNLRHSLARNVIEQTFGLLKKRWAILRTQSFFDMKTQVHVINACCILHNFIQDRQEKKDVILLREVDEELAHTRYEVEEDRDRGDSHEEEENVGSFISSIQVINEWTISRKNLAMRWFNEYQLRRSMLA